MKEFSEVKIRPIVYITSIGEPTTELCVWSLERLGFETKLIKGNDSFNAKLEQIYNEADDDFLRVDADVIVNSNVWRFIDSCPKDVWWYQSMCFDWWKMDIGYAGVQYIKKECLPAIRKAISTIQHIDRPESYCYRLPEFHNPRRCIGSDIVCGLHGFAQNDIQRVKDLKNKRRQEYDFELAERIANDFQITRNKRLV